jgi:hypothetical protein
MLQSAVASPSGGPALRSPLRYSFLRYSRAPDSGHPHRSLTQRASRGGVQNEGNQAIAFRSATERHGGAVGHPSGRADAMSASGRGKASAKGGQATVSQVFSLWIVSANSKKIPPLSAPPLIRGARGGSSLREPVVAEWHCGMIISLRLRLLKVWVLLAPEECPPLL